MSSSSESHGTHDLNISGIQANDLTMDARVLLTAWFLNGNKTRIEVGGATAKSRVTERAKIALIELESSGHITCRPVNAEGRMLYQATEKDGQRLSLSDMEQYGAWSPTEPNPNASDASRAMPTATIFLSTERRSK